MTKHLRGAAVFVALLLAAPAARAASPIPEFPSDGVALSDVRDTFGGLRKHLADMESRTGAKYAACVVRFTESRNRPGREHASTAVAYVDRVAEAWLDQLDPANHIVICLSVENRGIAIHPGSRWTALGFEQSAITKVIDQSPFARTARSGDLSGALERLVDAVDLHLSLRVQADQQRAVQVRDDVAAYGRDIAKARAAAEEANALTAPVEARLAAAVAAAQAASQRLDADDVAGAELDLRRVHAALADVRAATESARGARVERARLTAEAEELINEAEALARSAADSGIESSRLGAGVAVMQESARELRAAIDGESVNALATAVGRAGQRRLDLSRVLQQEIALAAELERIRAAAPAELLAARTRLTDLRAQVEESPRSVTRAGDLEEGARALDEADQQLVSGDPRDAVRRARTADTLLDGVAASLREAREEHVFYSTTLPLITGGALVAVLLLLLFVHTLVRRAARRRALLSIERWRRLLGRGSTRLVKMRDDHPFLFGSQRLAQRFTGVTAEHFQAMGEGADDLFLTYGAAANQLKRAEAVYDGAPAIGWGNFNLVVRLLDESPVEISREQVDDAKLFLPETRIVTRPASELLEHLSEVYEDVYAKVHALETELVEVPEILSGALDALGAAEDALSDLRMRGLDVGVYEALHGGHRVLHDQLRGAVERDPIGVRADATSLQGAAETLMGRLRRVRAARDVLDDVLNGRLAGLRTRISTLRREGLRLSEPGFEPERMGAAAEDAGAAALTRAAAGEDHAALNAAHEARDTIAEMERLVEATVASRDTTPRQLSKLRDEELAQRSVLEERGAKIDVLRTEHDERAIVPALDNAEEAQAALAFVADCIDQAHAALDPGVQRFLAAAELARRALHVLADVSDLYGEIDRKARELADARYEARDVLKQAVRRVEGLSAFLTADGRFASQPTTEAVATLAQHAEEEQAAQTAERPHWPERLAAARALLDHEQSVRAMAEEEHRARAEARELSLALGTAYQDAEKLLRASTDDRPPANRRMADAATLLGRASQEENAEYPDWDAIVALLGDARRHVDDAVRMAREDIALADTARRAIGEAHDAINDADRSYGHGVRARLGRARGDLRKARNALAVQQYESARKTADEARMKAADARRTAVRAARTKAAAELTQALAIAGVSALGGRSRRSSWSSRSSSGPSWSSGSSSSSSSSWGRSSSSGGFGSSSGGSSFGGGGRSSSGGSSFRGSSSGGSSW